MTFEEIKARVEGWNLNLSIFEIYDEVKEFIEEAKKYIPEVQATIVTHQEGVDEEKCEEISKNEFDVKYRPRRYNIVG